MTKPIRLVAVGGSDAGISAALRAREVDADAAVTVIAADAFPNFSICGIPYYIAGEVGHWRRLAHRSIADLDATGMRLMLDTTVTEIDVQGRRVAVRDRSGTRSSVPYDALVVGTGAVPMVPPIDGLSGLGPGDGVHVLHSMDDTFLLERALAERRPATALIVGAGYVGLEMAEALTTRGIAVTQAERLPEVLPTLDPPLGALVRAELGRQGVDVHTSTTITSIVTAPDGSDAVAVSAVGPDGEPLSWVVDIVLVVAGVRPNADLLVEAGARTGPGGAIVVDDTMASGLPGVWAAGDCVVTHHRQLGATYLPLGTTAHKQGRVAGENALGGDARFAGSLGTQVVKVFDAVAARSGLREDEARSAGFDAVTVEAAPDDHKAYMPGAHPIAIRICGDRTSGRLLGAQMVGTLGTEIAKRIDVIATALFHKMSVDDLSLLDLSYTPPLGSPWDALQTAAQAWSRDTSPVR